MRSRSMYQTINNERMNGKAAKKIRQQYRREFREEVRNEAHALVEQRLAEQKEQLTAKVFKTRKPVMLPRFIWNLMLRTVCTRAGVALYKEHATLT